MEIIKKILMDKNNKKNSFLFFFLLGSLFFGILGGIFSYFYFYKNFSDNQLFSQELDLSSWNYDRANFVIQDAKKVVINQDLKIEENIGYFEEAVVGVFKKSKSVDDFYFFDDSILTGLIVSSDGWVMINILGMESFDKNLIKDKSSYVVVAKKDKKIHEIEDVVYSEKEGVLFLKIKDINNFSVKSFVSPSDLKTGQSLILYDFSGKISPTNLLSKNSTPLIKSTDKFKNILTLNSEVLSDFKNSFLFDLNGSLVGLVSSDAQIHSINDFKPVIFGFFKNKKIDRVKFGLTYVNLFDVVGQNKDFYSEGAWLYNNGLSAVEKGSLAEKAGFKTDDIITRVNDYKIDSKNDLFDVLNNFTVGDKLVFYVLRNDNLLEIKVDLQ